VNALQRFSEGSVDSLPTIVDDVFGTVAVVEAACTSQARRPGDRAAREPTWE